MKLTLPAAVFALVMLVTSLAITVHPLSARPTYTLDTDPMRLGRTAWEAMEFDRARVEFQRAIEDEYQVAQAEYALGRVAAATGNLSAALAHFQTAIDVRLADKGEDYPDARAERSIVYFDMGRMAESAMESNAALAAAPKLWSAVYARALHLIHKDKTEAAANMIERGAKRKGWPEGEDRYHHAVALIALATGDLDAAELHAGRAAAMNPHRPAYPLLMARVYGESGIPALAANAYEQALAIPGFSPTASQLMELGAISESLKRYNEARDHYVAAIAADSTFAPVVIRLADLLARAGQNEIAARTYQRYLSLEPTDVDAILVLVKLAEEAGRVEGAADAALRAHSVDSTRVDVRRAVVRTGLRSRNTGAQKTALQIYSQSDPGTLTVEDHLAAGVFFSTAGRTEEAERSLNEAIYIEPENADIRFRAGMVELESARPDSAAARFAEAAALDSTHVSYFYNWGVALVRAGELTTALEPLLAAVNLDAEFTEGRLLLARTLLQLDSPQEAYPHYERVLEIEPDRVQTLLETGYCAILLGDFDSAVLHYQDATGAVPTDADAWAGLGNAYLGLQDWNKAAEALGRARELDPANTAMRRGFELLNQARSGG